MSRKIERDTKDPALKHRNTFVSSINKCVLCIIQKAESMN